MTATRSSRRSFSHSPFSTVLVGLFATVSCSGLRVHGLGYCFRDGVRASTENRPAVVTRVRLIPLFAPSPSHRPPSTYRSRPMSVSLSLLVHRCECNPPPFAVFYGNTKFRWARETKRYQTGSHWPLISTGYCRWSYQQTARFAN